MTHGRALGRGHSGIDRGHSPLGELAFLNEHGELSVSLLRGSNKSVSDFFKLLFTSCEDAREVPADSVGLCVFIFALGSALARLEVLCYLGKTLLDDALRLSKICLEYLVLNRGVSLPRANLNKLHQLDWYFGHPASNDDVGQHLR